MERELVASFQEIFRMAVLYMLDDGKNGVPANSNQFCPVQEEKISLEEILCPVAGVGCSTATVKIKTITINEVVSIAYDQVQNLKAFGSNQGYTLAHKVEIPFIPPTVIKLFSLKIFVVAGAPSQVKIQVPSDVFMSRDTLIGNISAIIYDVSDNVILGRGGNISAVLSIYYDNKSVAFSGPGVICVL